MKQLLLTAALASLAIISCSKNETETIPAAEPEKESSVLKEEPVAAAAESVAATPEEQGKKLIEGTDCLSCHKVDAKLVGPSYEEVAAKYTEADIDMLAAKIIDGGKGNWGEIPMTPHSGMSKDNAKLMVKYILSLKK